ncbi:MAG: hypothetical protein JEZ02_12150 [Desulfatibacillum sp.]|nr:hypothetical protein [Desulfatibacillum sp.]
MTENSRYMVVITGKPMPGHAIANVRNNVALRFNMQDARVDKIFSGRPVAIKRNLDLTAAKKFKEIFAQLGAECLVMADKTAPGGAPPKAEAKKPPPPAKSKEDLAREVLAKRAEKQFTELDSQYLIVGKQSGFEKTNVLFSLLTLIVVIGIVAAWVLIPLTWYMAVPAILVVLIGLGVPLMRSQTLFLRKVMAALVDEDTEDLALSLACMDTWLDRLDNQRHAVLIRKELDKVIGRHTDLMEKMMDYAYSLAEISEQRKEEEPRTPDTLEEAKMAEPAQTDAPTQEPAKSKSPQKKKGK